MNLKRMTKLFTTCCLQNKRSHVHSKIAGELVQKLDHANEVGACLTNG